MEAASRRPSVTAGHDNDLRRLGLSSAEVIANLRDQAWPATPGHENEGTVALINTFRHMFSRLSPSMWQVAERLEDKMVSALLTRRAFAVAPRHFGARNLHVESSLSSPYSQSFLVSGNASRPD